ncbi:MAG: copper chaperone PCu(A)C [Methylobacterium mesophilicum]|nr:copper chaperone PCu(A)C [Methylobacterium mesophilicum]
MLKRSAASLGLALWLATPGAAHDFRGGTIEISHPWSRPTTASAPVASGYMKLMNMGRASDRLLSVSSPVAERAELHRFVSQDGATRMRPVSGGLPVASGATVDFEADRLHVMFIKPTRTLRDGDRFPATLMFEKAGPVDIEFVVQRRASGASSDGHAGHGTVD